MRAREAAGCMAASCEVRRSGRDWKVRSLCQGPNLPCSRTRGEIQPAAHLTPHHWLLLLHSFITDSNCFSYITFCSILELIRPPEDTIHDRISKEHSTAPCRLSRCRMVAGSGPACRTAVTRTCRTAVSLAPRPAAAHSRPRPGALLSRLVILYS